MKFSKIYINKSRPILHSLLFKDTHLVAKDPVELNNAISACLINLNIVLYHASSLNIYKYLNDNQLKNHRHIHIIQSFSYYQLKSLPRNYLNMKELHLFQNLLSLIKLLLKLNFFLQCNYSLQYNANLNKISSIAW